MSIASDNVSRFATRAEQRIHELRRSHIAIAVDFLLLGDADAAQGAMLDCLDAQAKVAGIGGAA